jgi:hypothetical protein
MSKKRLPNVSKINTKYLIQISESYRTGNSIEGTTETGADYGHLIEEIEAELFARQQRAGELKRYAEEREHADHMAQTEGKQCTKCLTTYAPALIASSFSKVAGSELRYRPACKACHAKEARERRAINKTEVPF